MLLVNKDLHNQSRLYHDFCRWMHCRNTVRGLHTYFIRWFDTERCKQCLTVACIYRQRVGHLRHSATRRHRQRSAHPGHGRGRLSVRHSFIVSVTSSKLCMLAQYVIVNSKMAAKLVFDISSGCFNYRSVPWQFLCCSQRESYIGLLHFFLKFMHSKPYIHFYSLKEQQAKNKQ